MTIILSDSRLPLSFLLVFLLGCSPSLPIEIGYHGSIEGLRRTKQAVQVWESVCGRQLFDVRVGDGEAQTFEIPPEERLAFLGEENVGGRTYRDSWGDAYRIVVVYEGFYTATMAHELGHALGLEHTEEGVMGLGNQRELSDLMGELLSTAVTNQDCKSIK